MHVLFYIKTKYDASSLVLLVLSQLLGTKGKIWLHFHLSKLLDPSASAIENALFHFPPLTLEQPVPSAPLWPHCCPAVPSSQDSFLLICTTFKGRREAHHWTEKQVLEEPLRL